MGSKPPGRSSLPGTAVGDAVRDAQPQGTSGPRERRTHVERPAVVEQVVCLWRLWPLDTGG